MGPTFVMTVGGHFDTGHFDTRTIRHHGQFDTRTFRHRTIQHPDNSTPGHFDTGQSDTGQFNNQTIRQLDNSTTGHFDTHTEAMVRRTWALGGVRGFLRHT